MPRSTCNHAALQKQTAPNNITHTPSKLENEYNTAMYVCEITKVEVKQNLSTVLHTPKLRHGLRRVTQLLPLANDMPSHQV